MELRAESDGGESVIDRRRDRRALSIGLVALVLLYALSCWIRIHYALVDPHFDVRDPAGLLKTDPGLSYYVTERVIEAGGLPPADFRRDPGPCWPETADLPAMLPVTKEFLVAWAWKLFGGDGPLHVFIVQTMGWVAGLAILGVFALTWELTRSPSWSTLAAALWTILPYNYRTRGLILQDEDLAFPLYAFHLWLAARVARTNGWFAWGGAGLALLIALSSWQAIGFFLNIEVAALWLWTLRTGRNPLAAPRSTLAIAIVVLGCLLVPVLATKSVLFAPSTLGILALWLAARLPRRVHLGRWHARLAPVVCLVTLFAVAKLLGALGMGSQQEYGHVTGFLWAKLRTLGRLPADPSELPFDVRLLWQGPFVTSEFHVFQSGLGLISMWFLIPILVESACLWIRSDGARPAMLLGAFLALSLVAAWLVERTMILPGVLLPVAAVDACRRRTRGWVPHLLFAGVLITQATWFFPRISLPENPNYIPEYTRDLKQLVHWADGSLPREEGVLGDFIASTALLAHSRIPIVLQPKYELADTRRRIERFYTVFAHGTLEQIAALMREWKCRVLLVDYNLWSPFNRYILGIPLAQKNPTRDTPAWYFLDTRQTALSSIPGFRLLYRSPGTPGGFRVFELL